MEVLKTGNFNDLFPLIVKCERVVDKYGFSYGKDKDFCGSELEVLAADIKKHNWDKYPNISGTDYGVVCPVCGKFIPINIDRIPEKIIRDAQEFRFSDSNRGDKNDC